MGNDERVSAETALRIGLVTEVVARDQLWDRAHEIAATIAAKPPTATQGTVKAIWESLDKPYRAAMDQGLIYTRLGNPLGKAELGRASRRAARPRRGSADGASTDRSASPTFCDLDPAAPAIEYDGRWFTWGQVGDARTAHRGADRGRAGSGSCCATGPPTSRRCSACCWPAAPSS